MGRNNPGVGGACGNLRALLVVQFGLFLPRRDKESSHWPLRGLRKRCRTAIISHVRHPGEGPSLINAASHRPLWLYWTRPEMVIGTRYSPRPAQFDVTPAAKSEIVDWRNGHARAVALPSQAKAAFATHSTRLALQAGVRLASIVTERSQFSAWFRLSSPRALARRDFATELGVVRNLSGWQHYVDNINCALTLVFTCRPW